MAKKRKEAKKPEKKIRKDNLLVKIILFVTAGYVLSNIVQAIFCGTQSVDACRIGIYFIPLWIIFGIILLLKRKG